MLCQRMLLNLIVCTMATEIYTAFLPGSRVELKTAVDECLKLSPDGDCYESATAVAFSPQSNSELKIAVEPCLKLSPQGDCSNGPNGPIGQWDVSRVTDMSRMFLSATSFNGDLSKWDVSSVDDMYGMFRDATSFNGDITEWDVSSVVDTRFMFMSATSFNGDLSKWDVSSVGNMDRMFHSATSFNGDISKWDVSSVAAMASMFWHASSFGADISKWDVSSVTNMYGMFSYAAAFNRDISKWDVSSVADTSHMFMSAALFNGDLSKWDVSRVSNMASMFLGATSFNGDISEWDVSSVTNMYSMFMDATSFTRQLCGAAWVQSEATKILMFKRSSGSISEAVCTTTSASATVLATRQHVSRQPITERELITSKPISTSVSATAIALSPQSKAELKTALDACLRIWPQGDCSNNSPNGPIGKWDVSRMTDMSRMFSHAKSFNGDLSNWDVSSATNMAAMFSHASSFNRDILKWDVSSVTDTSRMFMGAASFNGALSKWKLSSVTTMASMFMGATSFNGVISEWDVSRVTDMSRMFMGAASFNGDLSKWDVSRVTNMASMFMGATSFNADIAEWDVSSVAKMDFMFMDAKSFKWELCGAAWVQSEATKILMFKRSTSPTACTTTPASATAATRHYVSRLPITERELIARRPLTTPVMTSSTIAHTMTCPKCGTFQKSGRVSCCAPGGAWFKNCGGAVNKHVHHSWFDGVEACKLTTKTISSVCPKCGNIKKSGKMSCCGRGGSWFKKCGAAGNTNFDHMWVEGIQACKARSQSAIRIGQQLNTGQQKNIDSPNATDTTHFKTVITPSTRPMITSVLTLMTHTSSSTSITGQGCENLLDIAVHITLLFIIVF